MTSTFHRLVAVALRYRSPHSARPQAQGYPTKPITLSCRSPPAARPTSSPARSVPR
jgi:hypothetical protein